MPPREKNPRREVLARLKDLIAPVRAMIRVWDQQRVVQEELPGGEVSVYRRRNEEMRENDPARWDQLIEYLRVVESRAAELRRYAEDRRAEASKGKRWT